MPTKEEFNAIRTDDDLREWLTRYYDTWEPETYGELDGMDGEDQDSYECLKGQGLDEHVIACRESVSESLCPTHVTRSRPEDPGGGTS